MAIDGLAIIGETINDSIPSIHKRFEEGDIDGVVELARFQDQKGAAYIDVNVGGRSPEFMGQLIQKIQTVTAKPLAIDTPDVQIARAGLAAYDPALADGQKPLLNSISPLRLEMFELFALQPFRPILLASEHLVDGQAGPCRTAEETYAAAKALVAEARRQGDNLPNDDVILDLGIAPLGSDTEGNLGRLIAAMEMIHNDRDLAGVHMSVGLSNFSVMLPPKRADGSRVQGPLESAFLAKAMPLGLDMVIGSVRRKYEVLPGDHPAMRCVEDCLAVGGFESIMRVREFYS